MKVFIFTMMTLGASLAFSQNLPKNFDAKKLGSLSKDLQSVKQGSEGVGGGDLCEDRIKVIRDDIVQWIQRGGSQPLALPIGVHPVEYSQKMLTQAAVAKIRCVGSGDPDYPVQVNKTPKVCRFDRTSSDSRITCDLLKFQSMTESDQYVLIHHEFAGLAGIEIPNGDDSDYKVSNQISAYLVDQVVKKLAVKVPAAKVSVNAKSCDIGSANAPGAETIFAVFREGQIFSGWYTNPDAARLHMEMLVQNGFCIPNIKAESCDITSASFTGGDTAFAVVRKGKIFSAWYTNPQYAVMQMAYLRGKGFCK